MRLALFQVWWDLIKIRVAVDNLSSQVEDMSELLGEHMLRA